MFAWRLFFGFVLLLLAGAILILWPLFEAAGPILGVLMLAALLVLSLTPFVLLGRTLRRTANPTDENNDSR